MTGASVQESTGVSQPPVGRVEIDPVETGLLLDELMDRHPAVGMSIAVIDRGGRAIIRSRGFANLAAREPVTDRTVFRIASVTKLFTAIAVMQLREGGLVDLNAPANDYLRAYRLVPARPGLPQPTVRHLLTHTSGVPDVVHLADLLHPGWGSFGARPAAFSVPVGERLPSLADYYGGALRYEVEPGRYFAYSNHGFATLGQLVTDVSGLPLDRYLSERILGPLGMGDSGLARPGPGRPLATGYEVGPGGARPVQDRDWITTGGGGIYATPIDMARFMAALLGGGANPHGRVLAPASLAAMFEPAFQPDPRVPGIGLAFFRSELGGHRFVGHDGRLPGFNSDLLLAPDDGIGVVALTNGSPGATNWLPIELSGLLVRLVGAEDRPWAAGSLDPGVATEVAGRYRLAPRVSDLRGRLMMGGGIDVAERNGSLTARVLVPVPSLVRGIPMAPSRSDPTLFRLDLSRFGLPVVRVAFARDPTTGWAVHTDLGCLSLYRQPSRAQDTRRTIIGSLLLSVMAVVATRAWRRRRGGAR
jgi:CubicO group peptidase (beta-lactamase class C family)